MRLRLATAGFRHGWGAVSLWVIPIPLVLFTAAYIVADAVKQATRRDAFTAVIILVPTAAVEWYFRFRGI